MDQKEIFKKYQERLINISARNRSLVLNKIYKKRSFDLVAAKNIVPEMYTQLIENFIFGEKQDIQFLPNSQKWQRKKQIEINKILKKSNDEEETLEHKYQEIQKNIGEFTYETTIDLEDSLKQLKEKSNKQLENMTDQLASYSHSLKALYREVEADKKESGLYNVKIAIYFAEGKFSDSTKCRAPLAFLAVKLIEKDNAWYLEKMDDEGFISNDVFMFSFSKCNQTKLKSTNLVIKENETTLNQLINYYEANGIVIEKAESKDNSFNKFKDITAKQYDEMDDGKLQQKPYLILGDFPLSNAIYEDYKKMIEKEQTSKQIDILFGDRSDLDSDEILEKEQPKESEYFYISELDYSQETAIINAVKHDNLVIFGPPGTGKSQTITNIIADNLAKGKKVLVVSQKRAALDVIYNRLGSIQNKTVLIHDINNGKKEFYAKNLKTFEKIESSYGNEFHYKNRKEQVTPIGEYNYSKKIQKISDNIDKQIDEMNQLYKFLYEIDSDGFTGQEVLLKSMNFDKILPKDPTIQYARRLFKRLSEKEITKSDLVKIQDNQIEKKSIIKYRDCRELEKQNPLLKELKSTYSPFDELDALDKLEELGTIFFEFQEKLDQSKNNICNKILNNSKDYSDAEINICKKVEEEHGALLKPSVIGVIRLVKMLFQRKKLIQIEEDNITKYNEILINEKNNLGKMSQSRNKLIEKINHLQDFLEESYLKQIKAQVLEGSLELKTKEFEEASQVFEEYKQQEKEYNELLSIEKLVIKDMAKSNLETETLQDIIENIEKMFCTTKIVELSINELIDSYEKIVYEHNKTTKEIYQAMESKKEFTKKLIELKWDKVFLRFAKKYEYRELKRISGLKRKVRSIREAYENHGQLLRSLYPCILLGPETVSEILPLKEGLYDIVIFDEASQMFVEEAIPSLYRGKKAIVAGDEKQLRPNSAFKTKHQIDDFEDEEFDSQNQELMVEAALEEESLLDLAKVTYRQTTLMFHYRSRYEELINFSNHAFYGGMLKTVPNKRPFTKHYPIERIKVIDGRWQLRANREEANEVAKLLESIFEKRESNETVGIITFNTTQKDAIEEAIESKSLKNPQFSQQIIEERSRINNEEDISLFVKNIENVQGDERDIIIFSTGYAKDEKGRVASRFGSLSQDGGENRLNVAISRAKQKIYVVTSFEPEDLNVETGKNIGPKRFKQYLQYVRMISNGELESANEFLCQISKVSEEQLNDKFDSDFEIEVCDAIRNMGYEVKTQIGSSGYKIDLVIYDAETSRYILGVECDGATFHSSKSAKENDIYRQKFLESRGWKIYRIWSVNWWYNKQKVLEELKLIIDVELDKLKCSIKEEIERVNNLNENLNENGQFTMSQCIKVVGLGDHVTLENSKGKKMEEDIESKPSKTHLLTKIQSNLIGKKLNEIVEFDEMEYRIVEINEKD